MNANELSDWLVAFTESNVDYEEKIVLESATMLRQQQRTLDGDKRLIDLLYEKVEKLQTEIDTYKSQNSSQIDTYRYETMRGNSVLVPSDKLKEMQEKITKYELRHAEQRKRIEELEHMMEKASHYEAMTHAGGFETGYQAAQADFNKENPVKEVFNRKAQEK